MFIKCFENSILLSGANRTADLAMNVFNNLLHRTLGLGAKLLKIWILYLGHLKPFPQKIIDFFFILGFYLGYCSLFQCYGHICRAPILRSVFTLWKQIANSGSKFQRIFNFGTSLGRLRLFVALHKGRNISEGVFQFGPSPKTLNQSTDWNL